ncbi:MAG: penicillin-binding protein 2 [Candidatus Latescibacterota bacterium]
MTAPEGPNGKLRALQSLVLALFAVLGLRLFYLQITTFADYARESDENRIAQKRLRAPRGVIYDRNGEVLARSRAFYTVSLARSTRQEYELAVGALQEALDSVEVTSKYTRDQRHVRLIRDVDFRTVSIVEERLKPQWPHLDIEIESQRHYPHGATAAHVLGYMGILQDEPVRSVHGKSYVPGDFIGKAGLEKAFEDSLRGSDGFRFVEVDADGRTRREFTEREQPPVAGGDLWLTLDLAVQQAAEAALPDSLPGAVVALDPQTGAVLAMASRPAFDPNIFVSFQAQEERLRVLRQETSLLNRAIRGRYPPGSTLKMVAATAALQEGLTDTMSTLAGCGGSLRVGDAVFHCMRAHGSLTLMQAMEVSCNVYFYRLGQLLGFDTWRSYGARFGLGQPTGIGLDTEDPGLLPTKAYYQQRGGWGLGHLLNLVIGQGAVLVTPLQMARYVSAIANGGYLVTPHLVGPGPPPQRMAGVSPGTLEIVRQGMKRVIHGGRGTGWRVRIDGITMGGKSGTAQAPNRDDDAWFVAFAPLRRPEIAVAVVVEGGGGGGAVAGPVAKAVMQAYMDAQKPTPGKPGRRPEAPDVPPGTWALRTAD